MNRRGFLKFVACTPVLALLPVPTAATRRVKMTFEHDDIVESSWIDIDVEKYRSMVGQYDIYAASHDDWRRLYRAMS